MAVIVKRFEQPVSRPVSTIVCMLSNMNVTVKDLLEATTKTIDQYETAKSDYDAAAKIWATRDLRSRKAKAIDKQRILRDRLSEGLKAKRPLTIDELRAAVGDQSSYIYNLGASVKRQDAPASFVLDGVTFKRPQSVRIDDLKALKAVLEAVTDETISDAQLARLGFKNMGWVFRGLVSNL